MKGAQLPEWVETGGSGVKEGLEGRRGVRWEVEGWERQAAEGQT